jgi:DnaJ-like protein/tetratricopeptide repeat protein
MTSMLPGLGLDNVVPTASKQLDADPTKLTPEDYFVFSRVDGRTSLRQLILISGFPEARAVAILKKLHDLGAIAVPGLSRAATPPAVPISPAAAAPSPPPLPRPRTMTPARGIDLRNIMEERVELTLEQKHAILIKHASLHTATMFEVLEVGPDADKRALKLAYRKLSKDFHPDRFFGRQLGSYKQLLSEIFDIASSALDILSDPAKRAAYVNSLSVPVAVAVAPTPPPVPPQARLRAAEIFEAACNHQVAGELARALEEFAEAIRIDPQPRFLRRAAEASLHAQELRLAEEYAKKATELDPNHAAAHRILAKVHNALGRSQEARESLHLARRLDPGNPHIDAELRDLGE